MNTRIEDLRRVTETYLRPELASTAVITHTAGAEIIAEQGPALTKQELL